MTDYEVVELDTRQKDLIKASVPILEKSGKVLVKNFYDHMINTYDEVKPFFNESNQKSLRQPTILAFALLNYAKNIDDPLVLKTFIDQIVSKHVGLQVKPEHYPIVGECLLQTMAKMLGPDLATSEFIGAWAAAYGNLAKILIDQEYELYSHNKWDGFKEFKVSKIIDEAGNVKSVSFVPVDGKEIQIPLRGQYICIRWKLPDRKFEISREYSLSKFPDSNEYQISVRLIPGGNISTFIHSQLKIGNVVRIAPPCGNFNYVESPISKNIIAFVGGIGITPLISIIDYGLSQGRKVTMFYSNRNGNSRPFKNLLTQLKKDYGEKFQLIEFFSKDSSVSKIDEIEHRSLESSDFDRVDFEKDHDYYILGPREYMASVRKELSSRGVNDADVHFEFFGPMET